MRLTEGFDDAVVRYSPGKPSRRPFAVETAHHQVKFHVTRAGRFGFEDLIAPEFTGAEKFSILQRLKDAVAKAPANSTFTLITTDREEGRRAPCVMVYASPVFHFRMTAECVSNRKCDHCISMPMQL